MSVFVLDRHKRPLMPCSQRRARLLLARKRAVVHRFVPFTIRLKARTVEESQLQPIVLKIDPGSQTTGMALARIEQTEEGEAVHHALVQRASYRRRRRSANLRYRPAPFANPTRQKGWLPPSLLSRIRNVLTWARRYHRWVPLTRIDVERVKFDLALLQNPELTGVEYQRGELFGWEVRSYLLEKFQHRCVYCGRENTAFELDHFRPRSRGGSNRVSNLALSCHDCNAAKGDRTASEFGHPQVEAQARQPLRDAAAVNPTRFALVEALRLLNLPMGTWSGGHTRWNRHRFGAKKTHALDVLCVGEVADVRWPGMRRRAIRAQGRGGYQRTNA